MERYCPACGTQRAEGSGYCIQCGHGFADAATSAAPLAAPRAAPPPAAAAAPTADAAPPPPLPQGIPPAPQPGMAHAALPVSRPAPSRRLIFVIAGLALFLFGLYQFLDGVGAFAGNPPRQPAASYATGGVAMTDEWLTGTWTPAQGARCATWVRFNADHTLVDESGNTGTWQISIDGPGTGHLTMTLGSLAPRTARASRTGEDILGLPGPKYWNRATC